MMDGVLFTLRTWSERMGQPYDTVRSWASGKRLPSPENRVRMAEALEEQAEEMRRVAEQLRKVEAEGGV